MQVKALCSGVVLAMMLAGHAVAAQAVTADQWLQRLEGAQGAQNYQGTFVYERKGAFSTHQVWHQVDTQGQLLERFLQLNGPAHEMMRVDGRMTCVSAAVADELATVDIWPTTALDIQQLQHSYDVRVLSDSRVADHTTAVLLFAPRDQHRYAVELHIDRATAVPLKTLLLNEHGELLERLQFVQFEAQTDAAQKDHAHTVLTPSANCTPVVSTQNPKTKLVERESVVTWTPPGFVLQHSHYKPSLDNNSDVLSQVYSDGLAHFSVFFEPLDGQSVEGGRRQIGPTAVVSRKVVHDEVPTMITVVGEIPLGSAERITLSVHAEQESAND